MKQIERIKYLLQKYLEKSHTPEEGEELFDLIRSIEDPKVLNEIFQRGWSLSGKENLDRLLSWDDLIRERERRSKTITTHRTRMIPVWKWAAAASVLVLIAVFWWLNPESREPLSFQTGFGEKQEILLDDGTRVILNANSSLIWHPGFQNDTDGSVYRLAELSGEAFFEVSHVDAQGMILDNQDDDDLQLVPFKVRTSDLTIKVLGTAFNVMSRRGQTDVYLQRGMVKLELLDNQNEVQPGNDHAFGAIYDTLTMAPGDMVSFSASTLDLKKIEAEHPKTITEWKDGTLVFENVEFGEMLDRLEDIYGKEIIIDDSSLLEVPVNFGVPYENWETVTKLMELSLNVNLNEDENNTVILEKRKG